MMIYYCKQGYNYQSKNNLQKAAQQHLSCFEGLLIFSPDALTEVLTKSVDELNKRFPKCRPLELKVDKQTYHTYAIRDSGSNPGSLISFSLFPINGRLKELPGNGFDLEIYEFKQVTND